MTWADFAILGIIAISALISIFRGFIREALSLATWLLAAWVSYVFAHPVSYLLRHVIETASLRLVICYAGLFILTLIVGVLINHLVGKLVRATGFSGTDRVLGIVFGIARGIVVVALLILIAGFTALPHDRWWRQSIFVGHVMPLTLWARDRLPLDIRKRIRYDQAGDAPSSSAHAKALLGEP